MEGTVTSYWLTRLVFQRGLAAIYLTAFLVALHQFRPLLGERGLLPVPLFIKRVSFLEAPSLFHFLPTDPAFTAAAALGIALSLTALTGLSERFGTGISMLTWGLLWVLYLSFVNVGQTFYSFGWESILLETGFLAIFLGGAGTEPSAIPVWLLRWVLFRVMFGAGLIKLRADPCWKDLSCMFYHYETQPMPGPLSWSFHWLPAAWHKGEVLFNHFIELLVPFGYFLPQPIAAISGLLTILFQGTLILSGNLSWLNWLTIVLALSTFTDTHFLKILPLSLPTLSPRSPPFDLTLYVLAGLVGILSIQPILNMLSPSQRMNASFNSLHLVNTYGAFGSVTRERREVVIEGTDDAVLTPTTRWKGYEFKGKPGDIRRRPPLIAPYHLRLDWLMWFLPLRIPLTPLPAVSRVEPWLIHLLAKLLQGDRGVLKLLRNNPFPDEPPRFVRALLYHYEFTTPAEFKVDGAYWKRRILGDFFPPVSLSDLPFLDGTRREGQLP
jgi:hypothetical protein